jgi:surface polysaccharide O-acyltransferase-like enzyme
VTENAERINLPIDLIRTVAIFLVILIHATEEPIPYVDIMSPQGVTLWWTENIYDSIASLICHGNWFSFASTEQNK